MPKKKDEPKLCRCVSPTDCRPEDGAEAAECGHRTDWTGMKWCFPCARARDLCFVCGLPPEDDHSGPVS